MQLHCYICNKYLYNSPHTSITALMLLEESLLTNTRLGMTDTVSNLVAFEADSDNGSRAFELQKFFPHVVRFFYSDVTSALALTYQPTYGMSAAECLTLLVLGPENKFTAQEIVLRSAMDKAAISRALERMRRNAWVEVDTNFGDGRSKLISLSAEGKAIYAKLLPQALMIEEKLLRNLSEDEIKQLIAMMDVVSANCLAQNES